MGGEINNNIPANKAKKPASPVASSHKTEETNKTAAVKPKAIEKEELSQIDPQKSTPNIETEKSKITPNQTEVLDILSSPEDNVETPAQTSPASEEEVLGILASDTEAKSKSEEEVLGILSSPEENTKTESPTKDAALANLAVNEEDALGALAQGAPSKEISIEELISSINTALAKKGISIKDLFDPNDIDKFVANLKSKISDPQLIKQIQDASYELHQAVSKSSETNNRKNVQAKNKIIQDEIAADIRESDQAQQEISYQQYETKAAEIQEKSADKADDIADLAAMKPDEAVKHIQNLIDNIEKNNELTEADKKKLTEAIFQRLKGANLNGIIDKYLQKKFASEAKLNPSEMKKLAAEISDEINQAIRDGDFDKARNVLSNLVSNDEGSKRYIAQIALGAGLSKIFEEKDGDLDGTLRRTIKKGGNGQPDPRLLRELNDSGVLDTLRGVDPRKSNVVTQLINKSEKVNKKFYRQRQAALQESRSDKARRTKISEDNKAYDKKQARIAKNYKDIKQAITVKNKKLALKEQTQEILFEKIAYDKKTQEYFKSLTLNSLANALGVPTSKIPESIASQFLLTIDRGIKKKLGMTDADILSKSLDPFEIQAIMSDFQKGLSDIRYQTNVPSEFTAIADILAKEQRKKNLEQAVKDSYQGVYNLVIKQSKSTNKNLKSMLA